MADHAAHKISIVVPVFNEEESLRALYDETTAAMRAMACNYELILVDSQQKPIYDIRERIARERIARDSIAKE